MADLNLFFPQWQGAGEEPKLYCGAHAIKRRYELEDFVEVPVSMNTELNVQNDILGYGPLMGQLTQCMQILQEKGPATIFTVGGGCDVELAPVSYLNERYNGNLSVLWFDAHGDLNTPQSSVSKLFHGMPLRFLLHGCTEMDGKGLFSSLETEQVTLIGTRDLDAPEAEYLKENGIKVLPVDHTALKDMVPWIETLAQNVYIHIDLDVLDPKLFGDVMCPVAGGLTPGRLADAVAEIAKARRMVGMSLLEYAQMGIDDPAVPKGDTLNLIKTLIDAGTNLK